MKNLFYQNKTDSFVEQLVLVGLTLLFVTLCLLISSYWYYQQIGRYSEIEYCFDNHCFVLTSLAHIKPQDIQEPPYIPSVIILPDNKIHLRHQTYLLKRCGNDAKCIQQTEEQRSNVLPFIPVTHDARTEIFLLRTKKRWLKKAVTTINKKLKNPSTAKYRAMTLKLTDQGFPIICGEVSDDLNTLINYQSFVYLGETDAAILLETEKKNNPQFSNAWQEHCF